MAVLTETKHPGEHVLSEGPNWISREEITLASGNGVVVDGTVLGKITASGKYKPHDAGASDGSQTAAATCFGNYDTTDGDQAAAAMVRLCEVKGACLTWKDGISQNDKDAGIAALAASGKHMIVRW